MIFGAPHLLWLLLALPPALIVFFWWSWKKRQHLVTLFIQARLLPVLTRGVSPLRQKVRLACIVAAVACVILALAQPQWGFSWQEVRQRGVDIVVAIDCSKSMLARDIAPNRLGRAKLAALELMQRARTDRLGLVAFAGSAFLQCPLTIDDSAFGQSVDSLDVNTVSQGGTALAEAIDTALTAFKEGENHRVLVLMTDGEDHDSGALEAAQKAAQAGMRIYTIGIGTPEGELIRIKDAQGREEFVRDEEGNVVKSRLNEDLLKQIATATEGGFYLPLRGAKTIDTLYEKGLAELPKSEHQEKLVRQYHQRFHWPLGAAIMLLIAEMLIPPRRREARPRRSQGAEPVSPKPVTAPVAVLLLLICAAIPQAFAASTGKALRDYKDGNYDKALKEYEQLLERKADDPRLHFNAGAAAYRNRQFDQAKKQFNDALNSPDLKLQERAYYNRGNSLYYLGEQTPDPKKRTEAWEQALKDFDLSSKLDPQDADAKFNHEFVKRKLEELKQQQQQQNKPDQNKSDQQDQNQNQQSDNSKQDQNQQQQQQNQQQQQSQQNQSEQKQDSQQSDQNKQDQEQQRQQQAQSQMGTNEQQQASQQKQPEAEQDDQKEQQAAAAAGQMTKEQAERLLDSQKGQEKMLSLKQQGKPADRNRRIKDW